MMILPLKFITGAAIGAVSTYVYKDEKAKQWLTESSKQLKEKTASLIDSLKKKPVDDAVEPAKQAATVAEGTVEAPITPPNT
ncbi:hypothetical protein [Thiothrix lacustris]|uniref:hypothetical protein n=1 Tax=Thiothrix lacustris TaxID=525917 RepID=UPI0027E493E1|nr:hypothetical protein [Thiothrix lacustris]WMP19455.1 hypothetical protein RCS87_19385 [Thiothrix lacustris]